LYGIFPWASWRGGEAAVGERSDQLRDGQQWPEARPSFLSAAKKAKGRASSELRNSPTRPQGGAAPKKYG